MELAENVLSFLPLDTIYRCANECVVWYPLLVRETKRRMEDDPSEALALAIKEDYAPIVHYWLHRDTSSFNPCELLILSLNHQGKNIPSYLMKLRYSRLDRALLERYASWGDLSTRGREFLRTARRFLHRNRLDESERVVPDDSMYHSRYQSIDHFLDYRVKLTDGRFVDTLIELYPQSVLLIFREVIRLGYYPGSLTLLLKTLLEEDDLIEDVITEPRIRDRSLFTAIDTLRKEGFEPMEDALDGDLLELLIRHRPHFVQQPTFLIRRYDNDPQSIWDLIDRVIDIRRTLPRPPYAWLISYMMTLEDHRTHDRLLLYGVDVDRS